MKKLALLLIFTLLVLLTACTSNEAKLPDNSVILGEASSEVDSYIKYTDGSYVYLLNNRTGDKAKLSTLNGSILERLELNINKDLGKELVSANPLELDIGIKNDIPCTYISTLEQSSKYVASLLKSGWKEFARYTDNSCCDLYLDREGISLRVVIFKNKLKVFLGVSGKSEDPYTYIVR